jgi:hypothetical protein
LKPVLQSICLLLGLNISPALTKAEPINSIKTAIAASTDLQEDPRFCDLDWTTADVAIESVASSRQHRSLSGQKTVMMRRTMSCQ